VECALVRIVDFVGTVDLAGSEDMVWTVDLAGNEDMVWTVGVWECGFGCGFRYICGM